MKLFDEYRSDTSVKWDKPRQIDDDQKEETVRRGTPRKKRLAVEKRKTEKINSDDINFFVAVVSIVISIVLSVSKGKLAITLCMLAVIVPSASYIRKRFGKVIRNLFFVVSIVLTCLFIGCVNVDDTTPGAAIVGEGSFIDSIIDLINQKLNGNTDENSNEVDDKSSVDLTEEFKYYESSEYNYQIEVPVAFCEEEDDSEEDLQLTTEDRSCLIVIKARYFSESIPKEFMIQEIKCNPGWTVIYEEDQLEADGWYVINAKNNEFELYRKCIQSGNLIRMFTLTFPLEMVNAFTKDGYDYVSHISNSFIKIG